jgi:hypothetical protein
MKLTGACLMLPLLGCDVHSTVGFGDLEELSTSGVSCAADSPLARCGDGPCVVSDIFDAPNGSISVVVDSEHVFFKRSQTTLGKRPLASDTIEDVVTDLDSLMRMTADATHVYWTEQDGRVRGVPKAGGPPFDASEVFGNPTELTTDSEHVYWVLPEIGEVAMAPKPTGEATQIGGQSSPQAIAVDATHVYWVNAGTGALDGQLVRAARGVLSSAELVRSGLDSPLTLTLGSDAIYFASMNTMYRMERPAGEPIPIVSGFQDIKAIRVYRDTIYGAGMEGLWRVPVSGGEPSVLEKRPMSALTLACSGVYGSGWFEPAFIRYAP